MKKKAFLFCFLIPIIQLSAQIDIKFPEEIIKYTSELKKYSDNISVNKNDYETEIQADNLLHMDEIAIALHKVNKSINNLTDAEFLELIKLRNEAYGQDPFILIKYFEEDGAKEIKKSVSIDQKFSIKLPVVESIVLRRISKMYGELAEWVHRIPILIKVKILERTDEIYAEEGVEVNVVNFSAVVEDICKGNNSIKEEGQIMFYMLKQWGGRHDAFEIGKSYFIGCDPRFDHYGQKRLAISAGEIYLVEDGILYDKNNDFKMGNSIQWERFKSKIISFLEFDGELK